MAAIILPKGNLIRVYAPDKLATPAITTLGWRELSDHNRSELEVSSMRIEDSQRMANGSLRKFWVADKKTFSTSWMMLPSYRSQTADGKWGAEDLREFYKSDLGRDVFKIRVNFSKGGAKDYDTTKEEEYLVSFTNCNFTLVKRGVNAFWNVSLSMEEV
jgi:hypothetical protein